MTAPVSLDDPRLWSPQDLAAYLGPPITVETVYYWNKRHLGPRYIRVGRHVRYRPSDVAEWLQEHQVDVRRAER